jgi:hypothetical protein
MKPFYKLSIGESVSVNNRRLIRLNNAFVAINQRPTFCFAYQLETNGNITKTIYRTGGKGVCISVKHETY